MSDRPIEIDTTKSTATNLSQLPENDEVAAYRAKIAQVLDRSMAVDMLHIKDLPPDLHGEWVSRDDAFIVRLQLLGYQIDNRWAPKSATQDKGDGSANVGDVVFMTIPKWKKEILDQRREQLYYETHIRDRRKQKEEEDFIAANRGIGMPVESGKGSLVNSQTNDATGADITQILTTPVNSTKG